MGACCAELFMCQKARTKDKISEKNDSADTVPRIKFQDSCQMISDMKSIPRSSTDIYVNVNRLVLTRKVTLHPLAILHTTHALFSDSPTCPSLYLLYPINQRGYPIFHHTCLPLILIIYRHELCPDTPKHRTGRGQCIPAQNIALKLELNTGPFTEQERSASRLFFHPKI